MLLNMSIEELLKQQSSSPMPADMDKFWDDGLSEVAIADDQLTMSVSSDFAAPGIECFDCYFTGVGGSRVYFKYARPTGKTGCKIVLQFHGYSCDSGDWIGIVPYAFAGFCIAALDCRGQGGKSEDRGSVSGNTLNGHIIRGLDSRDPKQLYFRNVFLDTAHMAKIVGGFTESDENYMIAKGYSQGGALTYVCASLVPTVKECYPVYPFLCDYKAAVNNIEMNAAFGEIKEYFRKWDRETQDEEAIFKTLSYIDVANLVHRITGNVMMTTGLEDNVCCAINQFVAYNRINAPKEYCIYKFYGHEQMNSLEDKIFKKINKL